MPNIFATNQPQTLSRTSEAVRAYQSPSDKPSLRRQNTLEVTNDYGIKIQAYDTVAFINPQSELGSRVIQLQPSIAGRQGSFRRVRDIPAILPERIGLATCYPGSVVRNAEDTRRIDHCSFDHLHHYIDVIGGVFPDRRLCSTPGFAHFHKTITPHVPRGITFCNITLHGGPRRCTL